MNHHEILFLLIGFIVVAIVIHVIHYKIDPDGWVRMMKNAYPTKAEKAARRNK